MSTFVFVERIKSALAVRHRGFQKDWVVVERHDLADLLYHFERLDSEVRRRHAVAELQFNQLQEARELVLCAENQEDSASINYCMCEKCGRRSSIINIGRPCGWCFEGVLVSAKDQQQVEGGA